MLVDLGFLYKETGTMIQEQHRKQVRWWHVKQFEHLMVENN